MLCKSDKVRWIMRGN